MTIPLDSPRSAATSLLLTDLSDRGLLDKKLVLLCGEFSGVQGGRIVGSTDRLGEFPKDRPVTPGDLHATIYQVLGVDPTSHFLDRSGRPVAAIDSGAVIEELF